MISDDPCSDIMGANAFESRRGVEWISILVKSGVYKGGNYHGAPRAIVDDVSTAVDWALENERRIEPEPKPEEDDGVEKDDACILHPRLEDGK